MVCSHTQSMLTTEGSRGWYAAASHLTQDGDMLLRGAEPGHCSLTLQHLIFM